MKKISRNIYVFWESEKKIPGYLEACQDTWKSCIGDFNLHIINYKNINDYIGGIYDLDKLKKISLPKQSDAVSVAVLEKFGGLFIDMDTIITRNIFEFFEKFDPNKLIFFGYPPNRGVHVAVMYSGNPGNEILSKWREQCQFKLNNLSLDNKWDSFGNSIVQPLIESEENKDIFHVIDCVNSGNILERCLTGVDARKQYELFYFSENLKINCQHFSSSVRDGMVSLHNSWTPEKYKSMSKSVFLNSKAPLADILNNVIFRDEINILNNLKSSLFFHFKNRNGYKNARVFDSKRIVVLDFVIGQCSFGLDFKRQDEKGLNKFLVDLVVRDDFSRKVLEKKFDFPKELNKVTLNTISLNNLVVEVEAILSKIETEVEGNF